MFGATGYARAARTAVLALHERGYPVSIVPLDEEAEGPELGRDVRILRELVERPLDCRVQILHITPDRWRTLRQEGPEITIGATAWETDRLHPIWTKACNSVDEVWVPSTWNVQVFRDSGVECPVVAIPNIFTPQETEPKLPRALESLENDDYVFYSIFQWHERKNPEELLETYWSTFARDPKAVLVLKTYIDRPGEDPQQVLDRLSAIKSRINVLRYARIVPIVELLSEAEVEGLHRRGDCFVLLQRAEGFGYPHREAVAHANLVLTTAYGGQTDFLSEDSSLLVDYQLRPVTGMEWSPYYSAQQRWASPDLDQASRLMERARQRRPDDAQRALLAQRRSRDLDSPDTCVTRMTDRLGRIRSRQAG
ncbi:MAG: hypothetical protein VYE73_11320 [Acidobacteriota bacterium]|nr:hypothetical protein [Acidobacteriota bacterium]